MTSPRVVVLEDSPDRVAAIQQIVGDTYPLELFTRAPDLIAWLTDPGPVALVSLDFHLGPREAGNGFQAAQALAALPAPLAPVILHSSDPTGAQAQQELLDQAGYLTERFFFDRARWSAAYARLTGA